MKSFNFVFFSSENEKWIWKEMFAMASTDKIKGDLWCERNQEIESKIANE